MPRIDNLLQYRKGLGFFYEIEIFTEILKTLAKVGGYHCGCRSGMMFTGYKCVDVDECSLNIHTCEQPNTCTNVELTSNEPLETKGYVCSCKDADCKLDELVLRSFGLKEVS